MNTTSSDRTLLLSQARAESGFWVFGVQSFAFELKVVSRLFNTVPVALLKHHRWSVSQLMGKTL